MRQTGTLLAASVAFAAIVTAPAPAKADDAELILRLLNGFIANGYTAPRGDFRGRGWNDDDDDGYRRGWHDDDDDGRHGRWNDDDDDDDDD